MIDWAPKDADKAVIFTCDQAYLPFAALMAWQIATKTGPRDFDIVIVDEHPVTLPKVLTDYGIRADQMAMNNQLAGMPIENFPHANYLRLQLAEHYRNRYRRILYFDSDMQFEGGDLSRLMELDLLGTPFGAVRDLLHALGQKYHADEFKAVGLPAHPYFNTGLLLIDTAAWNADEVLQRCVERAHQRVETYRFHDQSLLNVVMKGHFAELAPVWNWMLVDGHEPVTRQMPVRVNHFVTEVKPFRLPGQKLDRRFREIYRDFFAQFCPDWISELPPRVMGPPRQNRKLDIERYISHLRRRKAIDAYLAPFKDEWTVVPAERGPS